VRATHPAHESTHLSVDQWSQDQVIVIQHPLIAEQLDLVNLEGLMENPFQGLKVLVFVKNLGTQISLIEGVIQSASFVGSRWPWHSGVPGLIAKTRA
jgi:hypothetical protein